MKKIFFNKKFILNLGLLCLFFVIPFSQNTNNKNNIVIEKQMVSSITIEGIYNIGFTTAKIEYKFDKDANASPFIYYKTYVSQSQGGYLTQGLWQQIDPVNDDGTALNTLLLYDLPANTSNNRVALALNTEADGVVETQPFTTNNPTPIPTNIVWTVLGSIAGATVIFYVAKHYIKKKKQKGK